MARNYKFYRAAALLVLLFCGGCYEYKAPPSVLLGVEFLPANRDDSDRILLSISKLTLPDAKKITMLNNQSYQATLHYVNAARFRYYQSLGAYLPVVTVQGEVGQDFLWSYERATPPVPTPGRAIGYHAANSVSASYLLFDGFARYLNVMIQKSLFKREEAVQHKVMCTVKKLSAYAYFDLQLSSEIQKIQKANIEFQNRMAGAIKDSVIRKIRPEDELLNFQLAAGLGEDSLIYAFNQNQLANFSLCQLMGYTGGKLPFDIEIEEIPNDLPSISYTLDDCLNIALHNNPDMHIMEELLRVAEYNRKKSFSSFFPTVYGDFSYQNLNRGDRYLSADVKSSNIGQNSLYYGIRFEWLIFNGFQRYNEIRNTEALLAAEKFNMAETYLQILNNIQSAYSDYSNSLKRFAIYKNLAVVALKQRDLVTERYLNNLESITRLNQAQNAYVSTLIDLASAATDNNKAVATLEAIMMIDIFK